MNSSIPGDSILILIPQRTLGQEYYDFIQKNDFPGSSRPTIVTMGGLARRMLEIYWPIIIGKAGFEKSENKPIFLTIETAQFYLSKIVSPLIEKGFFDSVKIDHGRLLSQILDNLNKSAIVGFPYQDIAERLKSSWVGKPEQKIVFDEVQTCVEQFRILCLENNFLDFSLQIEVFQKYLIKQKIFSNNFYDKYQHLIYDNIEEDYPVAHQICQAWMQDFQSALLIYNSNGGHRVFLGADPQSAYLLKNTCTSHIQQPETHLISKPMQSFQTQMKAAINQSPLSSVDHSPEIYQVDVFHNFPEMVISVCDNIQKLVQNDHIRPENIAILSPYLSDSLRFSIQDELAKNNLPAHAIKPSRNLIDEPLIKALIAFAKLAHPSWGMHPHQNNIRDMLVLFIQDMDMVRADLLSRIIYRNKNDKPELHSFDQIHSDMQKRVTPLIGEKYEKIRIWLNAYQKQSDLPLDIFYSRVFSDLFSQTGYIFQMNSEKSELLAVLIESIRKFRDAINNTYASNWTDFGKDYIELVDNRLIAAQYTQSWLQTSEQGVKIMPATTFLLSNRTAKIQFWLDIGSMGWWQRVNQPLTHPYVLSLNWQENTIWTDTHEYQSNQKVLTRLVNGLLGSCTQKVFLCVSNFDEHGNQNRGPLLKALQKVLRQRQNFRK